MKKIRRQLRFSGRVQGVGFRYTAYHLAQQLGITGWVYNDWDGSVLMQAQGTERQIDLLIHSLQNGTFIEIEHIESAEIPTEPKETAFRIK